MDKILCSNITKPPQGHTKYLGNRLGVVVLSAGLQPRGAGAARCLLSLTGKYVHERRALPQKEEPKNQTWFTLCRSSINGLFHALRSIRHFDVMHAASER